MWDDQKQAWSGKTKAHVVKATVISDASRRPLWVEANPNGDGRTTDIAMLRAQTAVMLFLTIAVGVGIVVVTDRGYQTLRKDLDADRVETPIYRTRYRALTDNETRYNRDLSARRIPVEYAIGATHEPTTARLHRSLFPWHRLRDRRSSTVRRTCRCRRRQRRPAPAAAASHRPDRG